jgi:virulence-associated protein VagC
MQGDPLQTDQRKIFSVGTGGETKSRAITIPIRAAGLRAGTRVCVVAKGGYLLVGPITEQSRLIAAVNALDEQSNGHGEWVAARSLPDDATEETDATGSRRH